MSSPADPWVRVIKVKDGDSVIVRSVAYPNDSPYEVRLFGIDAPESAQPLGSQATAYLTKQALGRTFQFHFRERDQFGRFVGILYNPEHLSLNLMMVAAGWAYAYTLHGMLPGVFRAEDLARKERWGVWSLPDGGVRPWHWRFGGHLAPSWERRQPTSNGARTAPSRRRRQKEVPDWVVGTVLIIILMLAAAIIGMLND